MREKNTTMYIYIYKRVEQIRGVIIDMLCYVDR